MSEASQHAAPHPNVLPLAGPFPRVPIRSYGYGPVCGDSVDGDHGLGGPGLTPMKKPKSEYAIQTVSNALRVLAAFRDADEIGVADTLRRVVITERKERP